MKAPRLLQLALLTGCLLAPTAASSESGGRNDVARQLNAAFVEVAAKVSPSVVVITVMEKPPVWPGEPAKVETPPDTNSPDFWREFHRRYRDPENEPGRGQASGVIIRKDGYILTNRHVVDNAEQLEVRLLDGRTFKAQIRGVDRGSDVAVIKIDANDLPVARFADSSETRVGEFAVAIGAPFTYDYSVTVGHVSAKGRSNIVPLFEGGAMMDQDFIQTDANINPGNSGGPLLNLEGEVIGINTLIRGAQTGIGFAIPSNLAKEVSDKLVADGRFARPWLGVGIHSLKDDAEFHALAKGIDHGVVIDSILTNGPAAQADLRAGDVVLSVDGKTVGTAQQLRDEVRRKTIGRPVSLEVFRAGRNLQVKIKPAELVDSTTAMAGDNKTPDDVAPSGLGITVHALSPEIARQFGVDVTEGVIVVSVDRRSAAARRGIRPGDIITAIANQPVTNPRQFRDAVEKADLKKGVIVNVLSGDTLRYEILKEGSE